MRDKYLVTGADGHLGNNVVRFLLKKGKRVKAMSRHPDLKKPFEGLNVEVVYGDLLIKDSLKDLMKDVKILYQVALPIKAGSNKNDKGIIKSAIQGTENIINEAKKQGVKKIVYVSSISALGNESSKEKPLNEKDWNKNPIHPYVKAKVESEKLALRLAKKYDLWLVSVLPGTMVGPYCFKSTPITKLLKSIVKKKIHFDINLAFSIVNVEDIAEGMYLAETKGVKFNRYILANEEVTTISDIIERFGKGKKLKIGRISLKLLSYLEAFRSKISRKNPIIIPETIDNFYNKKLYCSTAKAKKELGWNPKLAYNAIKSAVE